MMRKMCISLLIAGACVFSVSCGDIAREIDKHRLPRPSDAGIVGWLEGQQIVLDKLWGVPIEVWTVEKGEVSGFQINAITQSQADDVLSAELSFKALASGRGLHINGILRYKPIANEKLQYVDFTPTGAQKIGNW